VNCELISVTCYAFIYQEQWILNSEIAMNSQQDLSPYIKKLKRDESTKGTNVVFLNPKNETDLFSLLTLVSTLYYGILLRNAHFVKMNEVHE
jgi:hypothetical protein